MSLFTATPTADRPIILFASLFVDNQNYGLVLPNRIGDLLAQNADSSFICENAAQFHWMIHQDTERLGDAACIRETLWGLSAKHHLLDVQLFEQLVQLASSGTEPSCQPLATLMEQCCKCAWEPPEQIATDAVRFGDHRNLPPDLVSRACNVARSLWNLYHALHQAAESAAQANMSCSADSPYGPLGLGIQVQARIALERPQPEPIVDDTQGSDVIAQLEQDIQQQTTAVRKLPRLANCLCWEQNHIVRNSDLLRLTRKHRARLRQLFAEVAEELIAVDGVPFPYLRNERGEASLLPEDWGELSRYEPNLHVWSRLYDLCDELRFIRKYQGQSIDVRYMAVPRLRPQPRAAILKALIHRDLLHRPGGGQHLVLKFEQLELRALAAWCDHCFDNSVMPTIYRNGEDPVGRLAAVLTPDNQIDEYVRIQLAELLLSAIAHKIGRSNFARMVQIELNLELDSLTVTRWEQATFELFPELREYHDDVAERLSANLEVSRAAIEQVVAPDPGVPSISMQVLSPRRRGRAFERLFDLIQDSELRVLAMREPDSAKLYLALLGRSFRLPTGRIRGKCLFEPGNAEYLDLADDAMKAAIYALAASRIEIVAVADRTVLVWAGEQFDERATITRASDAASGILSVPVGISSEEPVSE
jgi:hypothetical protein